MSGYQKTFKNQPQQKADKANKVEHPQKTRFQVSQMLEAPETLRPEDVLAAQQHVGNEGVQRSLDATVQRDGDEELKSLGGGSLNQVYKVTRPNGGQTGYFKPNNQEDPKMGAKSVLSSDIDEVLGLDSLARESYKKYSSKKLGTKKGMEGSESSEVPGTPLYESEFNDPIDEQTYQARLKSRPNQIKEKEVDGEKKYFALSSQRYARHDYTNPQTQKDLSNLQLQDSITGQHDRHGGNIRIDDTTGRAKGYDSDKMTSSTINKSSLINLPGLSKPQNGEPMTDEQKEEQKQSRIKAFKEINYPFDNSMGLPSHVDQTTAQTMMGMKSDDFIKSLKTKNKKNMKRLGKPHIEELRNRYKMVRRYVKAGLGANAPELIQDENKREKWSSPEYQQTVMEGVGMVPKIVDEWGDTSYNEQMNMPLLGSRKKERSYLQRGVLSYNEAQTGKESHLNAEEPEMGPLPTHIPETPWQKPSKPNKRHGLKLDLGQIRGGLPSIGQRSPRKLSPKDTPPVNDQSTNEEKTPPLPLPKPRLLPPLPKNRPLPTPPTKQTLEDEVNTQSDGSQRRQRLTNAKGELAPEINDAIQKKRGSGSTLPESVQKEAKGVLGREFKDVRIHTDDEAHRLSHAIHARAFTIGKDIFFKHGVFAPGSSAGRETILHELTHVVQQSGSKASGPLKLGAPDTAHEKEADQMGKKYSQGKQTPGDAKPGAVQKQDEPSVNRVMEPNNTGMPDYLKSGIESLSGLSMDDVKVHYNSSRPAQLQNLAYSQGSDIHVSPGQERHLPHEAWHVVQQPQGRIRPMLGDDTSVQRQGDEDELQAQPDAGGVVQRVGFDPEELRAKATEMQQKVSHKRVMSGIKSKAESMKLGSSEHMERLNNLEKKPELEGQRKRAYLAGLSTEEGKKNRAAREAENEKVKAKKAEKEAGTFKGGFKKAWKEEVSDPVSKFKEGLPGKIGGGIVKGGKKLGLGALKFAGSGLTEGFKHYFGSGKSEDKDKDDDKKDEKKDEKKNGKEDSKEDSGIGALMEKYAELSHEVKTLKEQLGAKKETVTETED